MLNPMEIQNTGTCSRSCLIAPQEKCMICLKDYVILIVVIETKEIFHEVGPHGNFPLELHAN